MSTCACAYRHWQWFDIKRSCGEFSQVNTMCLFLVCIASMMIDAWIFLIYKWKIHEKLLRFNNGFSPFKTSEKLMWSIEKTNFEGFFDMCWDEKTSNYKNILKKIQYYRYCIRIGNWLIQQKNRWTEISFFIVITSSIHKHFKPCHFNIINWAWAWEKWDSGKICHFSWNKFFHKRSKV